MLIFRGKINIQKPGVKAQPLRRQKQDCKFKSRLGYRVRPCLKHEANTKQKAGSMA
jgi:hypothetical protein